MENRNLSSVLIYPNPAQDVVYIRSQQPQYALMDLQGRTLASGLHSGSISLAGLAPGLYQLQVDGQTVKLAVIR